jgi:hypothetical protein
LWGVRVLRCPSPPPPPPPPPPHVRDDRNTRWSRLCHWKRRDCGLRDERQETAAMIRVQFEEQRFLKFGSLARLRAPEARRTRVNTGSFLTGYFCVFSPSRGATPSLVQDHSAGGIRGEVSLTGSFRRRTLCESGGCGRRTPKRFARRASGISLSPCASDPG